ncbi:MAG: 2-oxoglutarate dehydrogenase complex dihydrolipoyllysine-residue succinyltransferase, partial [Desulfobacterales bacterium]|nr:2-oxoglutarate dehydrogenase complex dihydrolipoyllysine-residue succinyltransferase [Desulfobacterales bacterium]
WFKSEGNLVKKDEPLFVIETDKVTLEVVAEADGMLSIQVPEGETVAVGAVVGTIDTDAAAEKTPLPAAPKTKTTDPVPAEPQEPKAPAPEPEMTPLATADEITEAAVPEPTPGPDAPLPQAGENAQLAPSVRRLVAAKRLDPSQIIGTGPDGRITKGDVLLYLEGRQVPEAVSKPEQKLVPTDAVPDSEVKPSAPIPLEELSTRKPMSPIRQRIAARLLEARQKTAMLTTFNEIDMTLVSAFRRQYKEGFKQKYGVGLGIMSFFIKAAVEALRELPQVNAFIDGKDIIEHHYYHIGVAVGSERGLVVPVIRHADQLSFAELEQAILDYVSKIKENRLELSDMEGGTFTISNGGVYGSLLSTPILNTPQSAILGMHKIEKRPVVLDDEVVIRPMMYVALSYDHRIIDGREAVTFLKRIKECVENPERIMMEI